MHVSLFFFLSTNNKFIHLIIDFLPPPPKKKNIYELVERTNIYGGLVYLRFPQNWLSLANYILFSSTPWWMWYKCTKDWQTVGNWDDALVFAHAQRVTVRQPQTNPFDYATIHPWYLACLFFFFFFLVCLQSDQYSDPYLS